MSQNLLSAAVEIGALRVKTETGQYSWKYLSHDLWKPALMTFSTYYVKIIWKTPKNEEIWHVYILP